MKIVELTGSRAGLWVGGGTNGSGMVNGQFVLSRGKLPEGLVIRSLGKSDPPCQRNQALVSVQVGDIVVTVWTMSKQSDLDLPWKAMQIRDISIPLRKALVKRITITTEEIPPRVLLGLFTLYNRDGSRFVA